MVGFIRKREILRNGPLVVKLYGWRVLFHCLVARQGETFLGILNKGKA